MRHMITGLAAAIVVVTASAAPAMACGWSSCSPCSSHVSRCGGLFGSFGASHGHYSIGSYGYGGGYGHAGYGYGHAGYGYAGGYGGSYGYQTLPAPHYAYVAQGPVYSGPGNLAPYPTYQEAAVSGYGNFARPVAYGYDGGRYANATTHQYDGAPARPHLQTWRPRASFHGHSRPRHHGSSQHSHAPRHYAPQPRWNRPVIRRAY